jgi:hypothetical protein
VFECLHALNLWSWAEIVDWEGGNQIPLEWLTDHVESASRGHPALQH